MRLENLFWDTLEEIGTRDGMNVPHLLSKLYDELLEHRGDIPADPRIPISSLNANAVLRVVRPSKQTETNRYGAEMT